MLLVKIMLKLKDICKTYITGDLKQTALNHVSLNLRENEFVAVLGPSGSGKTTLLNIIGGLDRYDSGDLIINDISTKDYTDRDWDSYRNHTVGFVFQSYNLIPHQTVLSNVELALTISGVSKAERTRRAAEALEKVGLGDQLHKKPNQMSGGQMQRVALARALVNDPDILLADEPTGALDSETSVQVMDLLKEVAKDRLVVMVTHNPELAEQYATRIVRLKDGNIISDTDPYEVKEENETVSRNLGKASMSLLTALSLSFNNLRTKKGRTFLVAFAGSIGIIGIALILSLSNGVNAYIRNIEEETMSEYPVQITGMALDFTSIVARSGSASAEDNAEEEITDKARELQMVTRMFAGFNNNDLGSLKRYLDSDQSHILDYAKAVEYSYNVEPQIWQVYKDRIRKVNPDSSFSSIGIGSGGSSNTLMASAMSTNIFYPIPENEDLYKNQYDVLAGKWPEKYNECIVVLTSSGGVSDFVLYDMGFRDPAELEKVISSFANETYDAETHERMVLDYEDFLDVSFKLVSSADYYAYDSEYGVWVDKQNDESYMKKLVNEGEDIRIVGVVKPKEGATAAMLYQGICYPQELIAHVVSDASGSEVLKAQQNSKSTNVFTGKSFDDPSSSGFDMSKLFTIDANAFESAFSFDASKLNIDFSDLDLASSVDMSGFSIDLPDMGNINLLALLKGIEIKADMTKVQETGQKLLDGFNEYTKTLDPGRDYSNLASSFAEYLTTPEARAVIAEKVNEILDGQELINTEAVTKLIEDLNAGYMQWLIDEGREVDPENPFAFFGEYLRTPEAAAMIQERLGTLINDVEISEDAASMLAQAIYDGYVEYAKNNQKPDPSLLSETFSEYISKSETQQMLQSGIMASITNLDEIQTKLSNNIASAMKNYSSAMEKAIASGVQQMMTQMSYGLANSLSSKMSQLAAGMQNAFHVDADAFSNAVHVGMDEESMRDLMMSMMSTERATYDGNLRKMGYADLGEPYTISIYPMDFDAKAEVLRILDDYNQEMEDTDQTDKIVSYTDVVGTLMSSVTTIIDTISYVLIAFVAVSLIVSSIMIGIITYISVLERIKEIGILRAIGASKRNISEVFNAETFIIGFLAGLLGVGITLILLVPINAVIHNVSGNPNINAFLPAEAGVILVIISVVLTLIGGLIPAKSAANKDPVEALRSE